MMLMRLATAHSDPFLDILMHVLLDFSPAQRLQAPAPASAST